MILSVYSTTLSMSSALCVAVPYGSRQTAAFKCKRANKPQTAPFVRRPGPVEVDKVGSTANNSLLM